MYATGRMIGGSPEEAIYTPPQQPYQSIRPPVNMFGIDTQNRVQVRNDRYDSLADFDTGEFDWDLLDQKAPYIPPMAESQNNTSKAAGGKRRRRR